jgi:hypothetical protein
MKPFKSLIWSVTLIMVLYFIQPGLLARACMANPTNYCQFNIQTGQPKGSPVQEPANEKSDDKIFAACIVAVIAAAVIGYIIYQIIKLCNKIPPPDPPPAPPTNSPPIVINPTTGPGPAVDSIRKMLLDTNQPSWGIMSLYDISSLGYLDKWAKQPSLFAAFWSTGITTSTNLINWENSGYRVDAFVSKTGTFLAYFHYGTNFYNAYFTETTNAIVYFDLTDRPYRPVQFFRLDPK